VTPPLRPSPLKPTARGAGGASRIHSLKAVEGAEPGIIGDDGEDALLHRTRSQLVDLAEAAEALEDADRQQREREQEQQGRLMQQLIDMQQQSNIMDVRAVSERLGISGLV
jgi:hypothetical protein